jgi:hypothetical protein
VVILGYLGVGAGAGGSVGLPVAAAARTTARAGLFAGHLGSGRSSE